MSPAKRSNASRASRRRFLQSLAVPAAAIVVPLPFAAALGAEEPATLSKPTPTPTPAQTLPATGPDFSVARTPEERATLEKQWKQMTDIVETVRKAKVADETPPAFVFAALAPPTKPTRP